MFPEFDGTKVFLLSINWKFQELIGEEMLKKTISREKNSLDSISNTLYPFFPNGYLTKMHFLLRTEICPEFEYACNINNQKL